MRQSRGRVSMMKRRRHNSRSRAAQTTAKRGSDEEEESRYEDEHEEGHDLVNECVELVLLLVVFPKISLVELVLFG